MSRLAITCGDRDAHGGVGGDGADDGVNEPALRRATWLRALIETIEF